MPFIKVDVKLRERLADIKGNDLKVWTALALHVNEQGMSWPSLATLAKQTGLTKRNIIRAEHNLNDLALIKLVEHGGQGPHSVNIWKVEHCSFGNSNHNSMYAVGTVAPAQQPSGDTDDSTWDPIARVWKEAKGGKKPKVEPGYWEANAFLDLVALKEGVLLLAYPKLMGLTRPVFAKTRASVEDMCDCYNRFRSSDYWGRRSPDDIISMIGKWFPTYLKLKAEGKLAEFLKVGGNLERRGGRGVTRLPKAYPEPPRSSSSSSGK